MTEQEFIPEEVREQHRKIQDNIEFAKRRLRDAQNELSDYEGDLHRLQLVCPHENVEEGQTWQGGGHYYTVTKCLDCGKEGSRYRPDLTRKACQDEDGNYKYSNRQEDYFVKCDERERYLYGRHLYWKTAEDRRREAAEKASKLPSLKRCNAVHSGEHHNEGGYCLNCGESLQDVE